MKLFANTKRRQKGFLVVGASFVKHPSLVFSSHQTAPCPAATCTPRINPGRALSANMRAMVLRPDTARELSHTADLQQCPPSALFHGTGAAAPEG